jgi:hypothetical protein
MRTARALRPHRIVHDDLARGIHWRGAKVVALSESTTTIRIFCSPGTVREVELAAELVPANSIGAPLCCRIADPFAVLEVRASHWPGGADLARMKSRR